MVNLEYIVSPAVLHLLKEGWKITYEDIYEIELYVDEQFGKYFTLTILGDSQGVYLPTIEGLKLIYKDIKEHIEELENEN